MKTKLQPSHVPTAQRDDNCTTTDDDDDDDEESDGVSAAAAAQRSITRLLRPASHASVGLHSTHGHRNSVTAKHYYTATTICTDRHTHTFRHMYR